MPLLLLRNSNELSGKNQIKLAYLTIEVFKPSSFYAASQSLQERFDQRYPSQLHNPLLGPGISSSRTRKISIGMFQHERVDESRFS